MIINLRFIFSPDALDDEADEDPRSSKTSMTKIKKKKNRIVPVNDVQGIYLSEIPSYFYRESAMLDTVDEPRLALDVDDDESGDEEAPLPFTPSHDQSSESREEEPRLAMDDDSEDDEDDVIGDTPIKADNTQEDTQETDKNMQNDEVQNESNAESSETREPETLESSADVSVAIEWN